MVVVEGAKSQDAPRVMLVAAVLGASASIITVGSATLSTGELTPPAASVLTMTALALIGFSVLRRAVVPWWWATVIAGVSIALFAPFGPSIADSATLSSTESTLELLWLAGSLALLVSLSRSADRHDSTRLRVSRLDGTLVAVSAATMLALTAVPVVERADATGRSTFLVAHAAMAVAALAIVVRHLLVTHRDRLFVFGVLGYTAVGLIRSWADTADSNVVSDMAIVGVPLAAAAFVLAVPLHVPWDRSGGRRNDLPNERVPLLGLCGLAPPFVALFQYLLGIEFNGVVLAAGMSIVLLLVTARLHVVIREVRDAAARDALVRQTTSRIAGARHTRGVSEAVMDAITTVIGPDLRFSGWVSADRQRGYVVSHFTSLLAHDDPLRSGLYSLLDARSGSEGIELIDAREGSAAVLTVMESPWQGFAVSCEHDLSSEALELLPTLATQAKMAIEGIAREDELLQKRSEARFEELVRHTNDAVVIVDGAGRIKYQTPSVVRLLGFLPVDLDDKSMAELVDPEQHEQFQRFFRRQVTGVAERGDVVDVTLHRADGGTVEVEMVGSNLLKNPDVDGLVLTMRDVTRHRELESQLRHQAFHDALTGLANRTLFVERLDHALTVNRRAQGPSPAVAFIDLDDFKDVNDTLGHAAGDQLLKTVSERIGECVRIGDTAARFGGDEFAVLFEHAESPEDLFEACERLLDMLHLPVTIGEDVVRVRASIGLATREDGLGESGEILRCADLAMYAAKAGGKGCVERYAAEMHEAMVAQMTNHNELERAIERGDIRLDYQPMVDLATDEVAAFEALARWDHPTRGPVSPAEFVPLAEQIGCIDELGESILRAAVAQLVEWGERFGRRVSLHVNISARQLHAASFVEVTRSVLDEADLDPTLLVFEVTESALVGTGDGTDVLCRLAELRDLGLRIAVDNFGTGFASLSYLQRVPFDVLKIDRSFVSALVDEDPQKTMVRTILDLADRLGVVAMAEGVERPMERDGLRQLGCGLGQGYLYGRPVSAAEATRQLDRRVLHPVTAIA